MLLSSEPDKTSGTQPPPQPLIEKLEVYISDCNDVNRFHILFGGENSAPDKVLLLAEEEIKTLGISHAVMVTRDKRWYVNNKFNDDFWRNFHELAKKYKIECEFGGPTGRHLPIEENLEKATGVILFIGEVSFKGEDFQGISDYYLRIVSAKNAAFTFDEAFDIVCRHIERENIARLVVNSENSEIKKTFVQKVEKFIETKKKHVGRTEKVEWSFLLGKYEVLMNAQRVEDNLNITNSVLELGRASEGSFILGVPVQEFYVPPATEKND